MLPTKRGARIEQVEEQKVDPRGDVDQEGYHEQGKSAADYGSPISSPASVHQPAPQVEKQFKYLLGTIWLAIHCNY